MAQAPILFDGVWKKFRRGERHDSLRDLIPATVGKLFKPRRVAELDEQEFWAVQDVSFEVRPGEALGIIGPNGAGKSTALKLLTRILRPTKGRCELRGRVGALIEVAAGFHPDLTGRENIYLQGSIMGMKRVEIARREEEIIDFAGVGAFVDTQVKRYSSGMNARLGFAIAAHLDPDVLIIDEVLSVGDMAFQEKCLRRMQQFRQSGVAMVFVSHNLQAVVELCDRAIFLKQSVQASGSTSGVMQAYVRSAAQVTLSSDEHGVSLTELSLRDQDGHERPVETVVPGQRLSLHARVKTSRPISDCTLGFVVYRSTDNLCVYDGNFQLPARVAAGPLDARIRYDFVAHLVRGQYYVACHVYHNPTLLFLTRASPAAVFNVQEKVSWAGVADLAVSVTLPDLQIEATTANYKAGPEQQEVDETVASMS